MNAKTVVFLTAKYCLHADSCTLVHKCCTEGTAYLKCLNTFVFEVHRLILSS